MESNLSEQWRNKGVESDLYILVRPDHHILYLADNIDAKKIKENFGNYFGK